MKNIHFPNNHKTHNLTMLYGCYKYDKMGQGGSNMSDILRVFLYEFLKQTFISKYSETLLFSLKL